MRPSSAVSVLLSTCLVMGESEGCSEISDDGEEFSEISDDGEEFDCLIL